MRNIYAKVCQGWDIICVLIIQWCLIIPERPMNVLAAKQMKPPLCFVLTQWRPLWEAPLQKITRKQQPSGKIDDRLVTWIAGLTHSRSHSLYLSGQSQWHLQSTFLLRVKITPCTGLISNMNTRHPFTLEIGNTKLKYQKTCHFLIMTLYLT